MSELEGLMNVRISQKFSEPRIRDTFQEVAENQASKMLMGEIQPAVDRFRDDLQKEYQTVAEKLTRLRVQNNLPILGDRAILEADRAALEEIIHIARTAPEYSSLRKAVIEEFERVNRQYDAWPFTSIRQEIIAVNPEDGRLF